MEQDISKLERELWNRRVQDRSNYSGQGSDSTRHRYWIYICIVVIVIALVVLFFLLKSGDGSGSSETNSKIKNEIANENNGLDETNSNGFNSDVNQEETEVYSAPYKDLDKDLLIKAIDEEYGYE